MNARHHNLLKFLVEYDYAIQESKITYKRTVFIASWYIPDTLRYSLTSGVPKLLFPWDHDFYLNIEDDL